MDSAIQDARRQLAKAWNETGCWRDYCDAGPGVTAVVTVALKFIGQLDPDTAKGVEIYLKRREFDLNGAFPSYPGGKAGEISATAACCAGLLAVGCGDNDPRVKAARAYFEKNGGETKLIELARAGDLAALALAMVGALNTPLPRAPSLFALAPGAEYLLAERFGYLIPFRALVSDVLATYLNQNDDDARSLRLPRLSGFPRSARDVSDRVVQQLDRATESATTTAASLIQSGADVATGLTRNTGRTLLGMAQGGLTAAAGVADSLRLGPLRVFEGAVRGALETGHAVVKGALTAATAVGKLGPEARGASQKLVRSVEGLRCDYYLHRFRNKDGSWLYGDSVHTALALAAYKALDVPSTDAPILESVAWLKSKRMMQTDPDGAKHFNVFYSDIWPTAFVLRALLESGTPVTDPSITRAINWLISVQRSGSWAFQSTNDTTPDMDDTAVAMATLAIARDRIKDSSLPVDARLRARQQEFLARCDGAIEAAKIALLGRQNADGGWASYQPGLPSKPRGAFMQHEPNPPELDSFGKQVKFTFEPPPELGDPATEDVTGRVLFALGKSGVNANDPAVKKAIQFLINQQDKQRKGGWWGRWVINYVASTAWVLRGLAAVGTDLRAPFIQDAIKFLLERQRDDGGWADMVQSYRNPSLVPARNEASNPCLTGLVVSALIELGLRDEPAVTDGIEFLLEYHGDNGWKKNDQDNTLHSLFPPTLFYTLPQTMLQLPLEALGLYRKQQQPARPATGRILVAIPEFDPLNAVVDAADPATLSQLKSEGDDDADQLIATLFGQHEHLPSGERMAAVFRILTRITDHPDPADLGELSGPARKKVQKFLAASIPKLKLDDCAEEARELFQDAGFGVPLVLFCSSLPQTYAVPYGAKVLMASGRLPTNPRRRLIETAQFIFDVLSPDGLIVPSKTEFDRAIAAGRVPPGRGIRAARKVRLMHAVIRKAVRDAGMVTDDVAPISQFEMIGTLMSFSVVVTDGLRALGFDVSDEREEAWFRLWNQVGRVLGIKQNVKGLPLKTAADGREFFEKVREDWGPSPEGETLGSVTLDVMSNALPGIEFDGIGPTLVRHLAGERCADLLGIPPSDWTKILVESSPVVATILGRVTGELVETALTPLLKQAAYGTMEALSRQQREGKGVQFSIPSDLLNSWSTTFHRSFRS